MKRRSFRRSAASLSAVVFLTLSLAAGGRPRPGPRSPRGPDRCPRGDGPFPRCRSSRPRRVWATTGARPAARLHLVVRWNRRDGLPLHQRPQPARYGRRCDEARGTRLRARLTRRSPSGRPRIRRLPGPPDQGARHPSCRRSSVRCSWRPASRTALTSRLLLAPRLDLAGQPGRLVPAVQPECLVHARTRSGRHPGRRARGRCWPRPLRLRRAADRRACRGPSCLIHTAAATPGDGRSCNRRPFVASRVALWLKFRRDPSVNLAWNEGPQPVSGRSGRRVSHCGPCMNVLPLPSVNSDGSPENSTNSMARDGDIPGQLCPRGGRYWARTSDLLGVSEAL